MHIQVLDMLKHGVDPNGQLSPGLGPYPCTADGKNTSNGWTQPALAEFLQVRVSITCNPSPYRIGCAIFHDTRRATSVTSLARTRTSYHISIDLSRHGAEAVFHILL